MNASPACQVCGGTDARPLVVQGAFEWLRCPGCGFAYLRAMPSGAEAAEIQDADMGARYIETYKAKLASKVRRSSRRVRRLARRMPGPRLLDVGSNIGALVGAAREVGLDAIGVEINPALVDFARELYPDARFVRGAVESVDLARDLGVATFDGIYCSEVIEHVPDNNAFVAAVSALLKPGGVLYLTTPGLHEYMRGSDPARWPDFGAPDHKLYYSRGSMRRMLEKHGFADPRFAWNFGKGLKLFARKI